MNENQLKAKIFILKAIDTVLILALIGTAIYSFTYAENVEFMIGVCLAILAVVNTIGRAIHRKVAQMGVQLEMLRRKNKTEAQRRLMGAR